MGYERQGDRYQWAGVSDASEARSHAATYLRCGMTVEARGLPGEWLVVHVAGSDLSLVSIDCPGDTATKVKAWDVREGWGNPSTPTERLADGPPHDAWLAAQGVDPDTGES